MRRSPDHIYDLVATVLTPASTLLGVTVQQLALRHHLDLDPEIKVLSHLHGQSIHVHIRWPDRTISVIHVLTHPGVSVVSCDDQGRITTTTFDAIGLTHEQMEKVFQR